MCSSIMGVPKFERGNVKMSREGLEELVSAIEKSYCGIDKRFDRQVILSLNSITGSESLAEICGYIIEKLKMSQYCHN